MVVLISGTTSTDETSLTDIVRDELVVRGSDGKSWMTRSFLLPIVRNVADGGENCNGDRRELDCWMSGKYLNAIKTQIRDLLHSSSLTSGRLILASSATYSAKIGLSIAVRYSLIRRAFSLTPNGPEPLSSPSSGPETSQSRSSSCSPSECSDSDVSISSSNSAMYPPASHMVEFRDA
ncbi:hypothetical protein AgCh_003286 [Apium graveolens]